MDGGEGEGRRPPAHTLMLCVASGASAGGCAGQLARCAIAIARRCARRRGDGIGETCCSSWVNRIDIAALLGTTDAKTASWNRSADSNVIDASRTSHSRRRRPPESALPGARLHGLYGGDQLRGVPT